MWFSPASTSTGYEHDQGYSEARHHTAGQLRFTSVSQVILTTAPGRESLCFVQKVPGCKVNFWMDLLITYWMRGQFSIEKTVDLITGMHCSWFQTANAWSHFGYNGETGPLETPSPHIRRDPQDRIDILRPFAQGCFFSCVRWSLWEQILIMPYVVL